MLNSYSYRTAVAQSGVSMIEVLVAIVVLSIGLLGLAGLQTTGLKHNQSANFRSTATMMAYSILDSMRASRVEADQGDYDYEEQGEGEPLGEAQQGGMVAGNTTSATDVNHWLNELALRLPGGTGAINVDANNKVTITITWDSRNIDREQDQGEPEKFVMTTRL